MRSLAIALGTLLTLAASPTASAGHKSKPPTTFAGAGQRLHFSFGGSLKLKANNTKVSGSFMILVHQAAPNNDPMVASCSYHEFGPATINGNTLSFDGKGQCKLLAKNGEITKIPANNHFTFADNGPTGDTIDVDLIGTAGVSIPAGELSFGDFTLTVPAPS